jgi:type IV secretion system protein VirB10
VSDAPDSGPRVDPTTGEVMGATEPASPAGARGIASVARERARRTTLRGAAIVGVSALLALGFLYFVLPHGNSERQAAVETARRERAARLNAEMPVRRLHVEALAVAPPPASPESVESHAVAEAILGPKPDPPFAAPGYPGSFADAPGGSPGMGGPPHRSRQTRLLASPVLYRTTTAAAAAPSIPMPVVDPVSTRAGTDPSSSGASGTGSGSALGASLRPTLTPAVRAERLPNRRWLLPKGSFADCTLETAIDSTFPGITTCVLALDVFSADGTVVLLERGTRLVGETRADVRPGQRRVSILWTEARTPTGVVAHLESLGTDELGRSGVSGAVDNHFSDRFGAAILISLIDAGAQALASSSSSGSGAVVINPSRSTDVLTEILRGTLAIPPTITIPQGARVQVLVARDVDFRSVYALKTRE